MTNFFFCHNVFKSRLLQMLQDASSIGKGLNKMLHFSAMKDSRFSPITKDEFPRLHCSVSILTHFEEANDYLDWEVRIEIILSHRHIYMHLYLMNFENIVQKAVIAYHEQSLFLP